MTAKCLVLALFFPLILFAQITVSAFATEYDEMFSSHYLKNWQTEKLKGQIKSCLIVENE